MFKGFSVMKTKQMHFELREIESKDIEWVQLIRTGKFNHAFFGKFNITAEVLKEFKTNFDGGSRGVDIAVDYFHESGAEAAGWFREIELRENDSQLWINVEWTDKAREKITSKEIRYISADFSLEYEDSETGKEYGATLFGAGLTNRPHVKNMQPVFSDEDVNQSKNKSNKKGKTMTIDFNDILASITDLSEDEKLQLGEKLGMSVKASDEDIAEAAKKLADFEAATKLADDASKSELKKLSDEVVALKKVNGEKDKEVSFTKMLSEGTAVEAQRVAFMEGNIAEFAKNAVSINLSEVGSGVDSNNEAATADKKLDDIVGKLVEDKGMTFTEATKFAVKENPELYKLSNS